jgi:hypothetical protein
MKARVTLNEYLAKRLISKTPEGLVIKAKEKNQYMPSV